MGVSLLSDFFPGGSKLRREVGGYGEKNSTTHFQVPPILPPGSGHTTLAPLNRLRLI